MNTKGRIRWYMIFTAVALFCSITLYSIGVVQSLVTVLVGTTVIFGTMLYLAYRTFRNPDITTTATSAEIVNYAVVGYVTFLLFGVWAASSASVSLALLLAAPGVVGAVGLYSTRMVTPLAAILSGLQDAFHNVTDSGAREPDTFEDDDPTDDFCDGFRWGYQTGWDDGTKRQSMSDNLVDEAAETARELNEAQKDEKGKKPKC